MFDSYASEKPGSRVVSTVTIVSGVGCDGVVKYCWNQYKSNFSLPNKFEIHSSVWPSSLDRNDVAFLCLLP